MIKHYFLLLFLLFHGFTCFSQSGAAERNIQQGILAYSKGDYKEALGLFQKCAILYKKTGNIELLGKINNNLGNTFQELENQDSNNKTITITGKRTLQ